MSKFESLPDRALELVHAISANLKEAAPKAGQWLETGAKFGALKTGARTAGGFIRRNPVVAVAAVAGAGLLWYAAARRKARLQSEEPIEGSARRVEARRANGQTSRRRTTRQASEESPNE
ncbi:hypothetical protein LC55x_5710 [Lysobacter capsici]|jgi:hypothetical protein|uniref:hypothetical protein n=1 Tax=Lysobacter capsici TaxID=435897 RepID=UPI00062822CE|nr:hypothetical protein [Lysobacter capsici]ALN88956.1 hypothetical protein LC55x_5710 [Lysobacter capsici]QWF17200.1 hypothetical protein KME82_26330 [Lysobacter capsici]WND80764.1 hypothetical protein RJ610_26395 [Lysobacter capsici]WND85960.1 hypothetical protein RJ609_26415 [Lysobacter capsici]